MRGDLHLGLTHVTARVANPTNPEKTVRLAFLVDSGAIYSVVPTRTLRQLGIEPHRSLTFTLADGTRIRRRCGDALFLLNRGRGASPVIFGERGDSTLLGTVSLESLGLMLDPIKRVLRPARMVLG